MTITLTLPDEIEQKLRQRANQSGLDMAGYIRHVLERDVQLTPNGTPSQEPKAFDEILEPVRAGFAASGLTEQELAQLLEEAREEAWREKQGIVKP